MLRVGALFACPLFGSDQRGHNQPPPHSTNPSTRSRAAGENANEPAKRQRATSNVPRESVKLKLEAALKAE